GIGASVELGAEPGGRAPERSAHADPDLLGRDSGTAGGRRRRLGSGGAAPGQAGGHAARNGTGGRAAGHELSFSRIVGDATRTASINLGMSRSVATVPSVRSRSPSASSP